MNQVVYRLRDAGRLRARRARARSSSRSSARPVCSTRRSLCARLTARSTTSSARSTRRTAQRRAGARHDAHQENGRGSDRLSRPTAGIKRALYAPRRRDHRAHGAHARPAPRRVRRARRHQPAARGSGHPRGVARRHPRCGQGGLPALGDHRSSRPSAAPRETPHGMVVLYADSITPSMQRAMDETERRRAVAGCVQ